MVSDTTPKLFQGAAKRIEDIDLPRIGKQIGVGEDVLHALIEVETRGTGFDKHNRVIMLFEPHVFYKHLRGSKRDQAVAQGLAYRSWGEQKYPADSYPRLLKAMLIDEDAALKSCSWGMGQIMGENHVMAGFDTVQAMVQAFADDEDAHLEAMVNFVIATRIDDDLRRIEDRTKRGLTVTAADWVPVVRVYNGTGYARNDYHNRAAAAYNRWLKIKDTPFAEAVDVQTAAKVETVTAALAPAAAVAAVTTNSQASMFQKAKDQLTGMEPESRKSLLSAVGSKAWGVLCALGLYVANNPFKIVAIAVIAVAGFAILFYYMKRQKDKTLAQIHATEAVTVAAIEAGK